VEEEGVPAVVAAHAGARVREDLPVRVLEPRGEVEDGAAAFQVGPGADDHAHAGLAGPPDHLVAVGVEPFVVQVRVRVDQGRLLLAEVAVA
jgi:hypothetical protein